MTVYREILASEVDPESPLLTALAVAWKDNVLSIAENDASVPYANLQLGEGMRTTLAEGHALVSDGAGDSVLVDGGLMGKANTILFGKVEGGSPVQNYIQLPIDTTSTYHCKAQTDVGGAECIVRANVIDAQWAGSIPSTTPPDDFNIVGSNLRFGGGGNPNITNGTIVLTKIS